ncbi:HPP family domain containing protein [Amanita muscaria]
MKFSISPQSSSMFNCISDSTARDPSRLHQSTRRSWPHPLGRLPSWISRWFGHRATPPPKRPNYEICLWSFIGTFCGVALLQAVFGHASYFIAKGAPPVVPSYAASAAIIYGAIEGPLAQPRSFIGGYLVGALTGVGITKLFLLLPSEQMFQDLLWLSGSLVSACTVVLMQITGMMHPPAGMFLLPPISPVRYNLFYFRVPSLSKLCLGAAAILALMNAETREMGWYYIPVILLSSLLALAVALIVNNIRRCYPLYWFFPESDPLTIPSAVYSVQGTNPSTRVNSVEVLSEKIEKPAPIHIFSSPV